MKNLKESADLPADKIFRKFGIRNGQLVAKNEQQNDKIDSIIEELEAAGFKQEKSAAGGEYQYEYTKDFETVMINYRYGKGYQAIWIDDK